MQLLRRGYHLVLVALLSWDNDQQDLTTDGRLLATLLELEPWDLPSWDFWPMQNLITSCLSYFSSFLDGLSVSGFSDLLHFTYHWHYESSWTTALSYYFLFKECVFVHYFILCINFSFFCWASKVLKVRILIQAHVLQMHSSLLSNPPVTHGSHRSYTGHSHTHAVPFLGCSLSPAMPVYSACPLKLSPTYPSH